MFAGAKKVANIIVTVDVNGQQIDGATKDVLPIGELKPKWESFGWKIFEMDGANIEEIISTLKLAKTYTGKGHPIVILMNTVMGNGVDFMMHTHKWHGIAPNDEQVKKALDQLPETVGDY
jgi:transketolase